MQNRTGLRHDLSAYADSLGKLHHEIAGTTDDEFGSDDMVAINAVEQACRAAVVILDLVSQKKRRRDFGIKNPEAL